MKKRNIDSALKDISQTKEPSKIFFFLVLLLYFLTYAILAKVAHSRNTILVLGTPTPLTIFSGVFSSLSNICIIFLVVLFKKKGFLTSLIILLCQFPIFVIAVFVRHILPSIPGIFSNIFTIVAITIIYINDRRLERYQERMMKQAVTDMLTGLPNRFACSEMINELIKKGERFAVVSIDLNNFKSINDTMGQDIGNDILKEIALRWKNLADSHKSGTEDFVAHARGDEYYMIVREYATSEGLIRTIEAYEAELERKITIANCDYFMTACFGYAEYPADYSKSGNLLSYADAAAHEIKGQDSSSKILHFSQNLLKTEQTLEMERKIRAALESDKIFFHLQPQYYASHKLRGFEVLARMKDDDGSFIPPVKFIPVAEKAGLIDQIDSRVFRKAACFLGELLKKKDMHLILCTNVSVRHLMKNNFIEEIKDIVKESGVSPDHFEIEITESIMIESVEKALQYIKELKGLGMKIAIDDFGTGYSSLSYLNKFPADMLKIDKSFIDVMNNSDSSKKYVATIISIGHVLNLEVISEGVETDDQLETLKDIGCDYIQGYLWGRPMPPEEAEKLVLSSSI
ncbi:MAG: EAL domain-containing protein [Treponema sp.]|nr:EAL domain-containing protein [Treponema sp.]